MFVKIFILVCVSFLQLSESLTLQIEGNKTSFTFLSETTSEIKFYVRDGKDFRVYVQHKALEKDSHSTVCIVSQSASRGCFTSNNICRCPEDADGAFSLNKTFQQSDAGLWMFRPWSHDNSTKTVNVSVVDSALRTKSPFILPTSQALDETTRVSTDVLSQTTKTSTLSTNSALRTKSSFILPTSQALRETARVSTEVLSQTTKTSTLSTSQSQHTDVTNVAIIVVLSFITLLAIVLTSLVWRHPGTITRLRRPPAIGEKIAEIKGDIMCNVL